MRPDKVLCAASRFGASFRMIPPSSSSSAKQALSQNTAANSPALVGNSAARRPLASELPAVGGVAGSAGSQLRNLTSNADQTGSIAGQRLSLLNTHLTMSYKVRQIGAKNSLDYRAYIEDDSGKVVSPFHDIPLYANAEKTILNMVVEIPRWTNAKLEISKEEKFNPILQDTKKGKLRFVRNSFPHKGYIHNYGAFPQTWEDPNVTHPETKAIGDNDPLDVCEIGEAVGYTGQIKQVKVLGVMALLDEGETDWKIIAIDVKDPHASKVNDIEDVERHFPGLLRATNEWFRIYKIPDGKPENQFAFSGESKNKKYAHDVIRECNEAFERLQAGKEDPHGISRINSTLGNANTVQPAIAAAAPQPDAPIDPSIDKWFFISSSTLYQ